MTKRHFIALADAIRDHNKYCGEQFTGRQLTTLANTFQAINPNFNRSRWLDYVAGKCGPNGGSLK